MAKKVKPKNTAVKKQTVTPVGRIVYPYLTKPDEGREYSDGKYKVCLMWDKKEFSKIGKQFIADVLEVARECTGNQKLTLEDINNPFRDGDDRENPGPFEGQVYITARTGFKPKVVGASKSHVFSDDEIAGIKGGDYARAVLMIYPYTQKEGGITVGLNVLQFSHAGTALGGGSAEALNALDDLEVPVEEVKVDEETGEIIDEETAETGKAETASDDSLALFS